MAMGVYGRLCVPRSIDLASILQQPCDPSVMLLIVTPAGSRASARARQSGGGEGGSAGEEGWRRADCERQEREDGEKERERWSTELEEWENSGSGNGEGETDGTAVSVGLCARTAKLVSLSPCTFMSPHVPLCPAVSLDAKSLAQPESPL